VSFKRTIGTRESGVSLRGVQQRKTPFYRLAVSTTRLQLLNVHGDHHKEISRG